MKPNAKNSMRMSLILENVSLGRDTTIEPFCYLGISPSEKNLPTMIGDRGRIRAGTYIYEGNIIGNDFQTGNKVNIRESNRIGNKVSIGTLSIIEHDVIIEDDVRIHSAAFVPEFSILKRGSWIGPHCVVTNAKYPRSKNAKMDLTGPTVGEGAKIGACCVILPGISIGPMAVIGAGSVVTKDVPSNSVIVGNPGRVIRTIGEIEGSPYQ